jgi:hypothetical protein
MLAGLRIATCTRYSQRQCVDVAMGEASLALLARLSGSSIQQRACEVVRSCSRLRCLSVLG